LKKDSFQTELDGQFQVWGDEGWELVKMEPISSASIIFWAANTKEFLAIFKREKMA